MAATILNITQTLNNSVPLRATLFPVTPKHPAILSGYTFNMAITDSLDATTNVAGSLALGDAGIYFDVPAGIRDVAGTYSYKIVSTDTNGDVNTPLKGSLVYA